ncbi:hypothetical protein ARMGADRAFT_692244 [Armillaria gallica]|uniref:Uncharacterized protein n=1 Tax=Armillaria gallica TaxID=47427 RepID=A0A2H3DM87_ARMGA|nr:hypothetical protein ARMGADRAFT_692244 [Armillaria gallica]
MRRSRCCRRRSFTWAILCVGCWKRMLEARYYLYLLLADPRPHISSFFFTRARHHLSPSHPLHLGCPFPILQLASSPLPSHPIVFYPLSSRISPCFKLSTNNCSCFPSGIGRISYDIPSIPMIPE